MDVERTMEFLLQQAGHHDARLTKIEQDLLKLNDVVLDIATSQERTNEIVAVLAERLVGLAERQEQTEQLIQSMNATFVERIDALAERQEQTEQLIQSMNATFVERTHALAERQEQTEQMLRALIQAVQRHVDGHE